MSCGPPCPPCPPLPPPPCPQICTPPPQRPPCRHKPLMRGLHWGQTTMTMMLAGAAAFFGGAAFVVLVKIPRQNAYKEYYDKAEMDDIADDMAKKGLFQAVLQASLMD